MVDRQKRLKLCHKACQRSQCKGRSHPHPQDQPILSRSAECPPWGWCLLFHGKNNSDHQKMTLSIKKIYRSKFWTKKMTNWTFFLKKSVYPSWWECFPTQPTSWCHSRSCHRACRAQCNHGRFPHCQEPSQPQELALQHHRKGGISCSPLLVGQDQHRSSWWCCDPINKKII